MKIENLEFSLPLVSDVFVHEANIYDISWKVVLSDSVLKHYIETLRMDARPDGLLYKHANWLLAAFPELNNASEIMDEII